MVVWVARGNSATIVVLPTKFVVVAVAACETDDAAIVAPTVLLAMRVDAPVAAAAATALRA